MPDLPTGTVTFLFTDIAGSTVLWEQQREPLEEMLRRVLREAPRNGA